MAYHEERKKEKMLKLQEQLMREEQAKCKPVMYTSLRTGDGSSQLLNYGSGKVSVSPIAEEEDQS